MKQIYNKLFTISILVFVVVLVGVNIKTVTWSPSGDPVFDSDGRQIGSVRNPQPITETNPAIPYLLVLMSALQVWTVWKLKTSTNGNEKGA